MRRRWSRTTKVRTRKRKRRRRSRKGGGRVIRKGENRNDCGVLVARVMFFFNEAQKSVRSVCERHASREEKEKPQGGQRKRSRADG